MGALKVNLLYANGTEANVWKLEGNQGNNWQYAETSIQSPVAYQVIFLELIFYNEQATSFSYLGRDEFICFNKRTVL